MPPRPDRTATAEEAAALIVALARARGLAPAGEIEDRAALLLGAFAQAHPEHPVARDVDRVEGDEIEAFVDAVARAADAGRRDAAHVVPGVWLNRGAGMPRRARR
jgi:hypothetical protein